MRRWLSACAAVVASGAVMIAIAADPLSATEEPTTAPLPKPVPAIPAPKAAENRLLDIARAGDRLVAVGQQGVILTSIDGKAWQQSPSPVSVMLNRVQFTDARNGWALGYDATLLQTTDGGATWTLRHHDAHGRALYDLQFFDAQRGLAVGAYGTMLDTRDGGATWNARDDAITQLGMHLNALVRLGDGTWLVVGERGLMLRSADEGASWAVLDSPYAGSLFGALPQGERGVLVYGMRGNVYASADPAATPVLEPAGWDPYTRETRSDPDALAAGGWRKLDSPLAESLFGAAPLPGGGALLVGVNGTTLRLTVGGELQKTATPAAETLAGVVVHDRHLVAVGRRGVVHLGAAP